MPRLFTLSHLCACGGKEQSQHSTKEMKNKIGKQQLGFKIECDSGAPTGFS
jgi:hypothetical protein